MPNPYETIFKEFDDKIIKLGQKGTIPYQSLLNASLNGLRAAADKTSKGAASGNYLQVGGGVADMLGSVLPAFSVLFTKGGPASASVFSILSGFCVVFGAVLAGFQPQPETLKSQIADALGEQDAKETLQELNSAVDAFLLAKAQFLAMDDSSHEWSELNNIFNFTEGNTVTYLHLAKAWLNENKSNPKWEEVFNLFYTLVGFRDATLALALAKVTLEGDSFKTAIALVTEYTRMNKEFAVKQFDEVRSRGITYHVGDNRTLYLRQHNDDDWTGISNPTRHPIRGSDITTAETDEIYVSDSGRVYGLDWKQQVIWIDLSTKTVHGKYDHPGLKNLCTIPCEDAAFLELVSPPPKWKDCIFILNQKGEVSYGPAEDFNSMKYNAIQLGSGVKKILVVPGELLSKPARQLVRGVIEDTIIQYRKAHLFAIQFNSRDSRDLVTRNEIILVPEFQDSKEIEEIFGPLNLPIGNGSFGDEEILGITQCGDRIYVYSKNKLTETDFTLNIRKSIELPKNTSIVSVTGSNDGQLTVVLDGTIWNYCPFPEEHRGWSQPDLPTHSATWAFKYGLDGANNLVAHLKIAMK